MYVFRCAVAVFVLTAWAVAGPACAQNPWHESFEASQPSWRNAGGDARYRVVEHRRVAGDAHAGQGAEWVRVEAETGGAAYLEHDIGRPRVIDELAPSVWVRSDRPGLQFAVRVALPRTLDSRTNQPLVVILKGAIYSNVGAWQQLRIEALPRQLSQQVRILRLELGPQVDDREAYIEAALLNVCGGVGVTHVWIDDLKVPGYATATTASSPSGAADPSSPPLTARPLVPVRLPPVDSPHNDALKIRPLPPTTDIAPSRSPTAPWSTAPASPAALAPPAATSPPQRTVRLVGSVLMVDGRPMFPRMIQHRGEPLAVLKQLGFNTVWLQRLPAPEMLEEAERLRMWLICPPPRPTAAAGDGRSPPGDAIASVPAIADIGRPFDSVLAWDLGGDLTDADLEATQQWAEQVQAADRRGRRPLVCRPRDNLRGFSRPANLLLIDRRPLGTSLEMPDYAMWVRQQPLLASLGTPIWTTVQTQPNEAVRQQLATLEPGNAPPLAVSPEQMRLLAYTAVASGSRGLLFVSESPLDASDPDTRQRAIALELLNLELALIEPWAAAGSFVATAESNLPQVTGSVLRTEHARLLLPLWSSPGSQCVPSQSAANALTLVAPGVPEASSAYELTPNGAQSLRHKRVAGGLCVTLDEFGLASQILLAHDPLVISAVHHRAAQMGRRAAELQRHLAVSKLNLVQRTASQLASRTTVPSLPTWLGAARKNLQTCDNQLASGDALSAALNAQRAMRALRLAERAYWDAAIEGLVAPVTSPAALAFSTLPTHWRLIDRLAGSRFSPNQISGADFENIDVMMQAGWRYILHPTPSVQATVDLVPQAARSGRLGVRLAVAPSDPKKPPAVIGTPPILFTSPAVQVEAGQIVCLHGWVQVPAAITASTDKLLIVDSLSGEALADRIGPTKGWRQFALYRIAPHSGPLCVTFALSGLGEAWLDDISIQILERSTTLPRR